jgi:hypothetical protein
MSRLLDVFLELGRQGGDGLVDVGEARDQAVHIALELHFGYEAVHGFLEELLGDKFVTHGGGSEIKGGGEMELGAREQIVPRKDPS